MALPALNSFEECADFYKTVVPYIPQLYDLPRQLLNSYSNLEELKALYLATNPVISAAAFAAFLCPIVWLASVVSKNYSHVDRLWSIVPTIYIGHYVVYAHMAGLETERLDNLVTCFVIWGVRLTFNFWRKGGYSLSSEDYRWQVVKSSMSPALWFIYNILFISITQMFILFIITTPTYVLLLATKMGMPLETIDTIIPRVLIALILLAFMADQQQWNFQTAKAKYKATAKVPVGFDQDDLDRGFVVTGMWSWARHPNFTCEQAIWVALYQWSCFITNSYFNWTGIGALSYLALFQASTWLTEKLSAQKYPEYAEYQQRVGKFLPKMSSDLPGDFSDQKVKPKIDRTNTQKSQKGSKRN